MDFIRAFKKVRNGLQSADWGIDSCDTPLSPPQKDTSGIALFMVIASISVLAILVTEFVYIAQINQKIAFGALDQIQAFYTAKSGLKISLLRLKAYQQMRDASSKLANLQGAPSKGGLPKSLIEKIWSLPFIYPIPSMPGMSVADKENLDKFKSSSSIAGSFTAHIDSESSKYNLNTLIVVNPETNPPQPAPVGTPSGTPSAASNPLSKEAQQAGLRNFISGILDQKFQDDPDFATLHRDLRMDELMDAIFGWADRTYERRAISSQEKLPMKKAPFYSVTELHMLSPTIDDDLYNILTPNLTAGTTQGININTMNETTLRVLVPGMTKEEVSEFFKYRDSDDADNKFKKSDDFFSYLRNAVGSLRNSQQLVDQLRTNLSDRNITLITDESQFKITVQAKVNNATKTIEAWVTLNQNPTGTPPPGNPSSPSTPPIGTGNAIGSTGFIPPPKSGLTITFMRMI